MRPFSLILIPALLLSASCATRRSSLTRLPPSQLRAAPSSVVIDGKQVVLATSLRRDFMPPNPRQGLPLVAVLRVQTDDGRSLPPNVTVDAAWLINGHDVWASVPRRETAGSSMYYEVVAREGPRWTPDSRVDVAVRLKLPTGESRILLATNQLIQRRN